MSSAPQGDALDGEMMDLGKTNYQRGDFYKSEEKQLLESNATRLEVPDGHLVKNNIGGVDFIPSNLANGGGETIVGPARNSHAGVGIALRNAGYGDYANAPDSAAYRVAQRGGAVNAMTIGEEQMRIAQEKEDNKSGFEKLLGGIGSLGIPLVSSAANGLSQITSLGDCDSFGDCAGRVLGGLGTIGAGVASVVPEVAPFALAASAGGNLLRGNVKGAAAIGFGAASGMAIKSQLGQQVLGRLKNASGDFASSARGYFTPSAGGGSNASTPLSSQDTFRSRISTMLRPSAQTSMLSSSSDDGDGALRSMNGGLQSMQQASAPPLRPQGNWSELLEPTALPIGSTNFGMVAPSAPPIFKTTDRSAYDFYSAAAPNPFAGAAGGGQI